MRVGTSRARGAWAARSARDDNEGRDCDDIRRPADFADADRGRIAGLSNMTLIEGRLSVLDQPDPDFPIVTP